MQLQEFVESLLGRAQIEKKKTQHMRPLSDLSACVRKKADVHTKKAGGLIETFPGGL